MKIKLLALNLATLLGLAILVLRGQSDGPLVPAGPPAEGLFKTLRQVEPRTDLSTVSGDASALHVIAQPGSYYLSGDVIGTAGKHGIVISADDVDLDLNGFALRGGPDTGCGIIAPEQSIRNCSIKNGTVCDWGEHGIDLGNAAVYTELRAVRGVGNGAHGFRVGGRLKAMTVTLVANGQDGLHCVEGSQGGVFIGVMAGGNGGSGIAAPAGSTLNHCSADNNEGAGLRVGDASVLSYCSSSNNPGGGLVAGASVTVTHSAFGSNGQTGIATGSGSLVVESTVAGSPVGVEAADASQFRGAVILGESVGLRVGSANRVYTPTITMLGNSGSAIEITGGGNRIEQSHVAIPSEGATGITAPNGDNLVFGLSVTGKGNAFDLPDGTAQGPVINGEELLQNQHPHANFSF